MAEAVDEMLRHELSPEQYTDTHKAAWTRLFAVIAESINQLKQRL